jgi:hypothetical protein
VACHLQPAGGHAPYRGCRRRLVVHGHRRASSRRRRASVLDVTLGVNGCYAVQSSPGAVGPLYVDGATGTPFINPLYAFDGCLGTP